MGVRLLAVALGALAFAPAASAKRGDIYIATTRYAGNDLQAASVLRIDPSSGAASTVASSLALPAFGPPMFVRRDGTVLMADLNEAIAISPAGVVRKLTPRVPGPLGHGTHPAALGFLASGGAAYDAPGDGMYASGPSLEGRLRLLRGSRRAQRPTGHVGGIARQLVASDGSIIGEVTTSSPGGHFVYTRFQRYDPRTGATRTIIDGEPIRSGGVNNVWGTLPGGGIVIGTGRPQHTVFYIAKPRRGRWAVRRFAPPWRRPVDDGGLAITGLPGGDIAIVRQDTKDNGGVLLDEGLQVLRLARGGTPKVLYEVAPTAEGDHAQGTIAVAP